MKMTSPLISVGRGALGDNVFTANQYARLIVRARTAPYQPDTAYQLQCQAALTAANSAWQSISEEDRQGWIDYAASLSHSGPVGTYDVPGRQVFLGNYSLSHYLHARGKLPASPSTDPPLHPGGLAIQDLSIGPPLIPYTGFRIFGYNPNPEPIIIIPYFSYGFDLTRYRYKGPWRTQYLWTGLTNSHTNFSLNFPGLDVDKRYFVRVRFASYNGPIRLSPHFYLNIIASTTT